MKLIEKKRVNEGIYRSKVLGYKAFKYVNGKVVVNEEEPVESNPNEFIQLLLEVGNLKLKYSIWGGNRSWSKWFMALEKELKVVIYRNMSEWLEVGNVHPVSISDDLIKINFMKYLKSSDRLRNRIHKDSIWLKDLSQAKDDDNKNNNNNNDIPF